MAGEDHCRMGDDPPTDGMCHLRLRTPRRVGRRQRRSFQRRGGDVGLSDGQTMMCVAGDFNAHIDVVEQGVEESIGRFGWGTRNREGRELVEMLRRNWSAVAGTFFQKNESHKINDRSGRHKTELDLLSTGGAATAAQEGEGLQSVGGRVCHHTAQTGRL